MIPSEVDNWTEFLEEHGAQGVVEWDEWVMCFCPFHSQSDKTRPSFGIYKETGHGNCFGCGGHTWEEICDWLGISAVDFVDGVRESAWNIFKNKLFKTKQKESFKRYSLPGSLINPYSHKGSRAYFIERGIPRDLLEAYAVRLCIGPESKYKEYAIFPIYDKKGVLFFDARYMGSETFKTRWLRPKDAAVDRAYFNEINIADNTYVCLVEGASDALKMIAMGFKNTIPAKYFSPIQLNWFLTSGFKHIFLAYDMDEAGRLKVNKKGFNISFNAKAKFMLSDAGMSIKEITFPEGAKDPGDIKFASDLLKLNPFLDKFV